MAKRARPRYPKGHAKAGKFMSDRAISARRSGRKKTKRNPGRTTMARKRAAPKRAAAKRAPVRRAVRRNPGRKRMNIVGSLMDGSVEAVQILIGKAAARSVPDLVGAPKQGNIGLAVQAATALVSGYVASMFLSANAARAILAGGLTAPLETLIVAYKVPWLSSALSPVSAAAELSSYAGAARLSGYAGMGTYAKARPAPVLIAERGLNGYVSSGERGMGQGYGGE